MTFNIFIYRIKKYIGAYTVAMNGVDAIVFTGGIGEKMPYLRSILPGALRGALGRKVKFLTIPTNEELLIAEDTYKLIKKACLPAGREK